MTPLDQKINQQFAGLVVRKDLVTQVKGNAIVPSYVLEYLLGQYCATSDEASIQSGIETVREVLRKHYVHRHEAGLIRSLIRERGRYKVIDKISVSLNEKKDQYEATFSNLGLKQVLVDPDTARQHPKMFVNGVWCIADLEYHYQEEGNSSPWVMASLKPIQLSSFDIEGYKAARRAFTTTEWLDVLMQSIGFNPEFLSHRHKILQLVRLIPYGERNYNLIELGPKGTGKSHIYSEFSPHGLLISGGEVTVAKLFVNNASGRIGLVGYWDAVAFDEFAGKQKRVDKTLVDILKNYMANKTFSRGIETIGAEASMVFVGNTQHTLPYMLRHSDLFAELPAAYHDSAFLDRLHFYIPGWEADIIRGEMFSAGYGFVVDYLAEILRNLRNYDYAHLAQVDWTLGEDISTRDRTAVLKTFSGLMKIIYPHEEATAEETEALLRFAIEGRKRVKDQIMRLDATYPPVNFVYTGGDGVVRTVQTLEERSYPDLYYKQRHPQNQVREVVDVADVEGLGLEDETEKVNEGDTAVVPAPGHIEVEENQRGISYEKLFAPYLHGATHITIVDPYIRHFYQACNLMELLQLIAEKKDAADEVTVHLHTVADELTQDSQEDYLAQMQRTMSIAGVNFSWAFEEADALHDRYIATNTGWKILLGRGLDIFQRYDLNDAFDLANRLQAYRLCKPFSVTYLRGDGLSPANKAPKN